MTLSEPLVFEPLSMQRIWGGRRLESLYGKSLPQGISIGESWEIVDRKEAQSVVHEGTFRGMTLHDLWTKHHHEIFGKDCPQSDRFPLLVKLLDARKTLSVQVHPPKALAKALKGEPKTEAWYFLQCKPTAHVFIGLKQGITKHQFEDLLRQGEVEKALHRVGVKEGDCIFIPSGRMHAIGAGSVIAEIQQNSDTTYRVFDWNRMGTDGKPRTLHVERSLRSIDFNDFEPRLVEPKGESLVQCPEFTLEQWSLTTPRAAVDRDMFSIFMCIHGSVTLAGMTFHPGQFFLVPACMKGVEIIPKGKSTTLLHTTL